MAKRGYYNGSDYVPYSDGPLSPRKVKERKERERKKILEQNYPQSHDLIFCPNCGSAYLKIHGQCPNCSESVSRVNAFADRQRQQRQKEQKTRSQMNSVLRVMRQGKTREKAAEILGIPISRINHWYREGVVGTNKDTSHFYRELKYIEDDRERRKREEVNRQNRLRQQEYERKQRLEKQRKERERQNQASENKISLQMGTVISQMRTGKNRQQAANYAGVSINTVNDWFDKGWRGRGQIYRDFYNKVSTIETRQKRESESRKTTKSSDYKKCPKCGKSYSSSLNGCPNCKPGYRSSSKPKISNNKSFSKNGRKEKMDKVVSLMKNGSSRNEAADKLGISVITINNWYDKGMRGDSTYVKFYEDVQSIEGNNDKQKPSTIYKVSKTKSKSKSKPSSKQITKTKTNTNSLSNIKYCQNCGKKIDKGDLIYCSKCGASLKTGKKATGQKTTSTVKTTSKNDSSDWAFCCIILFVIFIIIGFLSII